jgi:hypothetical protein
MMSMPQTSSETSTKNTLGLLIAFTLSVLANFLFAWLMWSLHLEGGVMSGEYTSEAEVRSLNLTLSLVVHMHIDTSHCPHMAIVHTVFSPVE